MRRLGTVALVILASACGPRAEAPEPGTLINGGFEQGLVPWRFEDRTGGGCDQRIVRDRGGRVARLRCERAPGPLAPAVRLAQTIEAAPFRGRRLRVRATLRVDPTPNNAAAARIVAIAQRADGERLFRVESPGRGSVGSYSTDEVVVEVPATADTVHIELAGFGPGEYHFDDVEVLAGIAIDLGNQPPVVLAPAEEDNLVALARLLGVLRYFHPSASARAADWDLLSIAAVERLVSISTPEALSVALLELLAPLAKDLHFDGEKTPDPCVEGRERHRWLGPALDLPMPAYRHHIERLDPGAQRLVEIELPRGLVARVPVESCAGSVAVGHALPKRPVGWAPSPADRATRLAITVLAWGVLEHFDPERAPGDPQWEQILRAALREVALAESPTTGLERMVAATNDGHALVGRPEGGREFRLPVVLDDLAEGIVVVRADSQATDVYPGDRLLRVDGREIHGVLTDVIDRTAGGTLAHRRLRAIGTLLHRPRAEPVELELEGVDGERRVVTLSTRPVGETAHLDLVAPDPVTEARGGILALDLRRVADADWEQLLPRLERASGLILDLRGYPRINEAKLGHFATRTLAGPRFCIPERHEPGPGLARCERWEVPPLTPRLVAPVAAIYDSNAMSYPETLLTMLAEHRLATLVGRPSAGTNGNYTGLWLPAGYRLYWTGMSADGPAGNIRGRGVEPDIRVEPTRAGIAAGRDEVLERAVELLIPHP